MRSTKIVVLKLKEIIYTALFVILGICLILLLVYMFSNKKESKPPTVATYVPGLYTSSIMLENKAVNVEVVVDKDHINSIRLTDLDPAIATLNPALVPTLQELEIQLVNDTSVDDLSFNIETKHTSSMLVSAIESALDKARPDDAKDKD
ncbi:hypothetical protein HZI73_21740 [Vallitalea pronyensis]|uniref:Uncharacterized protein n=1 Tax=Vallitalea pronyensis TaxID=1348613 RepID=A0A8J8SIS8_9FIRM|nr:hypothetical protein [Vallitalea pronyensis]QUI24762.1 hypothetical protein HZI73_21740 [Vallitalea pronyensis]